MCVHNVDGWDQGRKWESWKDPVTRFFDNMLVMSVCLKMKQEHAIHFCSNVFYFWTMQRNQCWLSDSDRLVAIRWRRPSDVYILMQAYLPHEKYIHTKCYFVKALQMFVLLIASYK